MSGLRYVCVLADSVVQRILCCIFALFFFVLCILYGQLLRIVYFWLSFPSSLMFIDRMATTLISNIGRVLLLVEQEPFTLPERMRSTPVSIGVHVARLLVFCILFCGLMFVVLFPFWHCIFFSSLIYGF